MTLSWAYNVSFPEVRCTVAARAPDCPDIGGVPETKSFSADEDWCMKSSTVFLALGAMAVIGANSAAFARAFPKGDKADSTPNKGDVVADASTANPEPPTLEYLFHQLDTNNDGKLSRQEWNGLPSLLSAVSAATGAKGKDPGQKSGAAFSASAATLGKPEALFLELDANHDNSITREEFKALGPKIGLPAPSAQPKPESAGTNQPGAGTGGSSSGSRETGPAK